MSSSSNVKVIDLFCGIGGLTHGFVKEGFNVVAGIDIDTSCKYGYEKNNKARFIEKDIDNVTTDDLNEIYGDGNGIKILIGCAPCQPFSTLNLKRETYKQNSQKWSALDRFAKLIEEVKPEIISMENVKELTKEKKYPVFARFLMTLEKNGYEVFYKVIDASRYGVPQKRKRLVLLASRLGKIKLIDETHWKENLVTVRHTISDLKPLSDGDTDEMDYMHTTSKLNAINKLRISSTPHNGGDAKDWDPKLLPNCYRKKSGSSYASTVYGRMKWDEPAPTMTTSCISLGTGRYGHPEQNRAISIREAARFQTFPDSYEFMEKTKFAKTTVAKHIGNAVPVKLGQVIAISIREHLKEVVGIRRLI